MGSLFQSQTKTTKQPFESNPWEPQQQYLKDGFAAASDAMSSTMGQESVAGMTPDQMKALGMLTSQGFGQAQDVSQAALSAGMGGIGNAATFGNNAGQIFNDVSQNRTGQVMADGQQFAENPYMQGQIDAALGDVRTAFDRDVSTINGAASATGNINSTRAGAMEARALDDAMDRGAMISSNMRSGAYENGMDRAMTMDQARTGNMMAANGQIGASGQMGLDFATAGLATGAAGAGQAAGAQGAIQNQNQMQIDGNRMGDMDILQRYMQLVGGNYGSQGFQTQVTESPSIAQTLIGGAATYAGAGGSFCWVAREVYGEDNEEWKEFRFWMLTQSPDWFFNLYTKRGKQFAGVVRKYPVLKRILRPLMNWAKK